MKTRKGQLPKKRGKVISRKEKGRRIAFDTPEKIDRQGEHTWFVWGSRELPYMIDDERRFCSCPDKQFTEEEEHRCKHLWAVWYTKMAPVCYDVVKVDNDVDGRERWQIRISRLGQELTRIGMFFSRADVYDAKWELEGREVQKTS